MLLIALSWVYILFTTVNFGTLLDQSFKLKTTDFTVTVLLGLLGTTLLGGFWAIFFRINIEFHGVLLVLNLAIYWRLRSAITHKYREVSLQLAALPKFLKLLFWLIALLIVAQCAALPFIIDNETYYVQTIKWLNEHGFVKGLGNLHIFLAQTSGWHIAQSIFNFSFLYNSFNDLSGFCLLLGNWYAINHLATYFKNADKALAGTGLFLLFNPLLFQFISAPSPDVAVFVISFVLISLFLQNFDKPESPQVNLTLLLAVFVWFIKPTAVVMLLIPAILFLKNFKQQLSKSIGVLVLCASFFGLFLVKNIILTGYPLYPTLLLGPVAVDFAVPHELISFHFNEARLYGFFLTKAEFLAMNFTAIFVKWITVSKINGAFNILSLLMVVVLPVFIRRFYHKKAMWILYWLMVIQLIILLVTSPQFRFFLNFILFFSGFIVACCFGSKRGIAILSCGSLSILTVLVFLPINVGRFSKNKLFASTKDVHLQNLAFPAANSNLNTHHFVSKGNLNYYSPNKEPYFWYSGNGPLPCVNTRQLDFFERKFHLIPQQRTTRLKDGFRSVKIKP